MCGRPAKIGCVDIWLTARHSVAVHTLNYLHAQLQVHTLDYRELSAHSGTRVSALDFTNVAMGPAGRREPGEHDGDSSAQSTARRDRMCDRHSRAEQLRLHTGPRGAGRAPRAQQRLFGPGWTTAHHWEAAWRPTPHRHLRRLLHAGYPDAARSRLGAYTRLIRALVTKSQVSGLNSV